MITLKYVGVGIACLALGAFGLGLSFSTLMFNDRNAGGAAIIGLILIVVGTGLSACSAYYLPKNWMLWPLLVGAPAFLFALYNWFIVPNSKGFNLSKAVALALLLVPLIGGYVGNRMKAKKSQGIARDAASHLGF